MDDLTNFRLSSLRIVREKGLPLPVKVELLDLGLNPLYQVTISENDQGVLIHSDERWISQVFAYPPFRMRFTDNEGKTFIEDLSNEASAS